MCFYEECVELRQFFELDLRGQCCYFSDSIWLISVIRKYFGIVQECNELSIIILPNSHRNKSNSVITTLMNLLLLQKYNMEILLFVHVKDYANTSYFISCVFENLFWRF